MKLEDLKEEHIEKILALWGEHVGGAPDLTRPEKILKDIQSERERWMMNEGYRIGSNWTAHSKLRFRLDSEGNVYPYFHDNMDRDDPGLTKARTAGTIFEEKAKQYLDNLN